MIFLKWNRLNQNCSGCIFHREIVNIASERPLKTVYAWWKFVSKFVYATFFPFWVVALWMTAIYGTNMCGEFLFLILCPNHPFSGPNPPFLRLKQSTVRCSLLLQRSIYTKAHQTMKNKSFLILIKKHFCMSSLRIDWCITITYRPTSCLWNSAFFPRGQFAKLPLILCNFPLYDHFPLWFLMWYSQK